MLQEPDYKLYTEPKIFKEIEVVESILSFFFFFPKIVENT